MAEEALTRDDFIRIHGFDPEAEVAKTTQPAPARGLPSLGNAARDLATGVLSIPTDFVGLPGTAAALAGAAVESATNPSKDVTFGKELAKRIRVDDADKRTEQHITQKLREWKQQYPEMGEEDLRGLLTQYQHTKEFEDFNTSLVAGGPGVAARSKDAIRGMLGDERTDKQRSWVDSALEVLGGSVVGVGPATGARLAEKAASTAIGRTLLENPISYGALRVAEAVTPLTLPLTPGNVALNAGVGIAMDQGMRYALGDTTAFTGNDSNLGGLATVAGATGAAALAVGALRGRAAHALGGANFPAGPEIEAALRNAEGGGASLQAGRELSAFPDAPPSPALAGGSIVRTARDLTTRGVGNFVDEMRPAYDLIARVHGPEVAHDIERQFSNLTGAGGRDTAHAEAATVLRDLNREFSTLAPEEATQLRASLVAEIAESRNKQIEARYDSDLTNFADLQREGKLSQADANRFTEMQDTFAKFKADAPETRRFLPDLARADIQRLSDFFRNNSRYEKIRNALTRANDQILNDAVERGVLTKTQADEMRSTTPFYAPLQQDPLEGATGIRRVARGFLENLSKDGTQSRNVNKPLLRSFDTELTTSADQSRITRPMDPLHTFGDYARNMYQEMQNNTARRLMIDALEKDAHGNPSPYMAKNNIERYETGNRIEFTAAELRAAAGGVGNPALMKVLNDPSYIRVMRNGMTSFYRFGDEAVAQLMRFEPTLFTGPAWVAKAAADLFKTNTTGALAPVFAPINAMYDTTFGSITRGADRAFGPLDTVLRKIIGQEWGKQLGGRIFDPTVYAALPWHMLAGVGEITATRFARFLAKDLANTGPVMRAISQAMGPQAYEKLVERMLVATERSKSMIMLDRGITHNSAIADLPEKTNMFSYAASAVPQSIRSTYQFYKDLVNAVHSAPKRQFWAQNYSLLEQKYGPGNIPKKEIDRLVYDTRALAGDMTRQAGSDTMRKIEAATPYMAPMRNGVYHLARSLGTIEGASYAWPRLTMAMAGVMSSFYMMSNWDENAKKEFWLNTPEWMRYRYIMVPTPELMNAWGRGEKPAFDPKLIYKMPIGPDLAPIVAGTSAFLRGIGALPNGPQETATTGLADFGKMLKDMFLPVFPPVINAPLSAAGVTVDIGGADARAGNVLRNAGGNPFRKGPQEESASTLGEMNTITQNVLSTLFGANGMYLARSTDALLHASKYDAKSKDAGTGLAMERSNADYIAGLKAATTTFVDQQVRRMPDVPILWKGDDKQYTQTPVQNVVSESKSHIASINGMRDASKGPRAGQKRDAQQNEGGIAQRYLTDPVLLQIADDIRKWDRSSDYAELKKEYGTLASTRRSLEANYTIPRSERMQKVNALIDKMQENMDQQRLAIMFKEQEIKDQYGPQSPSLAEQPVTMARLDALMRSAIQP